MNGLHENLLRKLQGLFGAFDPDSHRFTKSSNTEISRQLGYSDAQFSRLIHGSATNGEYERAIQNIGRILRIQELEKDIAGRQRVDGSNRYRIFRYISIALIGVLSLLLLLEYWFASPDLVEISTSTRRDQMLAWSFETSLVNPYIPLDGLPDDCNFPCYKYQGRWNLDETYKLPFFQEQTGFHYLATEVNMYARCLEDSAMTGTTLEGYEYQKHEIWYDVREWPIDSFLYANNELKAAYSALDFQASPDFIRVADVHTFFRDEITINGGQLQRRGQVIGRDIEFVPEEDLLPAIQTTGDMASIQRALNAIVTSKLEDFSRPVSCDAASAPHEDFNSVAQGDKIGFHCQLTTAGVPMAYQKTYVLTDQYIKNRCRPVQ